MMDVEERKSMFHVECSLGERARQIRAKLARVAGWRGSLTDEGPMEDGRGVVDAKKAKTQRQPAMDLRAMEYCSARVRPNTTN